MKHDSILPDDLAPALDVTQGELACAVAGNAASTVLLEGIVPGGTLDAAAAVGVYRSGYVARLTEQLGETWPSVWRVLGDDDFFAVCAAYIATHPSTSYNLSDYGREFPEFLATTSHADDVPMIFELAGFELVVHDLFHAPSHVGVDPSSLAALGDLTGVKLELGSAVRLLACRRAVYDVFRHRNDENPPDLDFERSQLVLLFKQDDEVLAREVDAATFAALEAMAAGSTVDDALARAVEADASCGPVEVARLFELIARCNLVAAFER